MQESRLVILWPTSKCNLSCAYCYAAGAKSADMDMDTAMAALAMFGGRRFKLQFAGGEPLLNFPLMERVMEKASGMPSLIGMAVQTNGTLLGPGVARELKRRRVAVGVSLDGPPETNEATRGQSAAAIRGILALREEGIKTNITTVVSGANVECLEEMVDLAAYLENVHAIGFSLLRKAGRAALPGAAARPPSPQALEAALRRLYARQELYRSMGKRIVLREFDKIEGRMSGRLPCSGYCPAVNAACLLVVPNGDVYPCGSLVGNPAFLMGNVHTSVDALSIEPFVFGRCEKCRYRPVCEGGCPARSMALGVADELDCVITQTIAELVGYAGPKREEEAI
jgi:uncharacterized protein